MARVRVDRDARGVVTCWLDNAERRNALTDGMLAMLAGVVEDATARAVILRGANGTFCSGRDLRELDASGVDSDAALASRIEPVQRLAAAVRGCKVPTVAVVQGKAAGLGVALASWCDFVLAETEASFAIPEARAGVAPSFTAVSLVRAIGRAAALDLCLSGRAAGAVEAASFGLVQRVIAPGRLDEEVRALADSLCNGSPQALAACKSLLAATAASTLDDAIAQAAAAAVISMRSSDAAEGMRAFRDKRPPRWAAAQESRTWPAHA
ncbi:MAG TPA: enoyl-CoA hydratase/isomerase family protein [Ramlibacter sp.]|uniref:enoyl-CoA hydratase/isomerase family protein n=1 Tax=Ramlibacter sp. TaxID=1917967 RepID=UPI002ED2E2B3